MMASMWRLLWVFRGGGADAGEGAGMMDSVKKGLGGLLGG